jgi:hypothetical protein
MVRLVCAADHESGWARGGNSGRDPGYQPAAADRAHHEVHVGAISDDLEPDRSLAGDYIAMVEWRDGGIAVRSDKLAHRRGPRGQGGLADDYPRTARPCRRDLDRGRVRGNNDSRRHIKQGRRVCDGMGMIAARVGNYALAALRKRQRADGRVSAAQFEGARRLQRFGLD